jgi:hypothetical protein
LIFKKIGLFFIVAGYRGYSGKSSKIVKELNHNIPAHELTAQEVLLSSLKEYKDQMMLNDDNNPYIDRKIDQIKSEIYTKDFMQFRKKYSQQKYTKGVMENVLEYFRFHQIVSSPSDLNPIRVGSILVYFLLLLFLFSFIDF